MERLDLLKELSFGAQVAEEETNDLASYFVETDQWTQMARGRIDVVRGEKGAGKSAIYSLLLKKSEEFAAKDIMLVAAENPRGATVFKDLATDPPTSEMEFMALWKLYILAIVARRLRDLEIRNEHAEKVFRSLEDAQLLEREFTLSGVLRRAQVYARRMLQLEAMETELRVDPVTQMPTGIKGRIVFKEPSGELKGKGFFSVDNLFQALDEALKEANKNVWVLLDRLDVAFTENHSLEANALRALIRVYADLRGLDRVSLKIFLREDIWKRITDGGFREASHIIKYVILDWTPPALLNLIMRRLLINRVLLDEFNIDAAEVLQSFRKQEELFDSLFPRQVEQGAQKSTTFKWMVSRCADGTRKTAPRELIHLLNCIRDQEVKRLEQGGAPAPDDQLFDRSVFKLALPTVSDYRLRQTLYAEYPSERQFLEKLESEKSEQTPETLAKLWGATPAEAATKASRLVEIGFFEQRGTKTEPTYWVPFLYRDALNLIQGRAESDEMA